MLTSDARLRTPLDAIFFDCDGTLSTIEGIDELAATNGVGEAVKILTAEAMGQTGINPTLYQKRLALTKPTQQQMTWLGQQYIKHLTPDVLPVIKIFQKLGKTIFIISAGLFPAIAILGKYLGIESSSIFAVNIQFDSNGRFLNYEEDSVLTHNEGKQIIVREKLKQYPRLGYVGDGLNDCSVKDLVTRFVGYGGAYYRENIAAMCRYYIKASTMAPILPLMLTADEVSKLNSDEKITFQKGLSGLV
ncbi:MAG: HAD-IB family phosphatase [Gammaproteobacteria bacterium]|nr:HAD-IB family phosphatase [Gammaproteobacteria bacterium]